MKVIDNMRRLTKKTLIDKLVDVDDDTQICIRCKTPYSGNSVYYDLDLQIIDQLIILHSDGLDLTVEADMEMIKEEEMII